ncbi:MAG TPA: fatty acid desaturase [Bryobacteraceae bacterium]
MIALALLHGLILVVWPVWPVMALGVWWNSNTISHNFIHRPFFRERWANRLFSAYLSALLGIPQALWRDLHLAHHADTSWRGKITGQIAAESALVVAVWMALALGSPRFFLAVYLPGYGTGLGLCALQGYYEHFRQGAVSHYGAIYNFMCFNDGYHAEHHLYPGAAWRELPSRKLDRAFTSRWPALLRWMDVFSLEQLERLVLPPPIIPARALQSFVLSRHRRAMAALIPAGVERVTIVGGGLFPRTALAIRELLPRARIVVIESNANHIDIARRFAGIDNANVDFEQRRYAGEPLDCDLAVIPLSYHGDRERVYQHPPAPAVLMHDWIWRRRGTGRAVSIWLLKRINRI